MKVNNAIILAAGTSSRFAPLSYEIHKALIEVKGDIMIERQIRQLREAGITDIYVVTGYKSEQLVYLREMFNVELIHNREYLIRNNHSSIWAARQFLGNSYICSVDNYFNENPFENEPEESYYAAKYAIDNTKEWCMEEGTDGYINHVRIGGENAWYMIGHAFWREDFSKRFLKILENEYDLPETKDKLWEKIFIEHLDTLKMKIRKYPEHVIMEFDTLDELREFDDSYRGNTRSVIIKDVAERLGMTEEKITDIKALMDGRTKTKGFRFQSPEGCYQYFYDTRSLYRIDCDNEQLSKSGY